MIPGCSRSSLTWSNSWQSSRYLQLSRFHSIFAEPFSLFSTLSFGPSAPPDGALSCHLRHPDQPDDQLDIHRDGEDGAQMLVQQGEELSSATRWHRAPCASHHITSLTHMMKSLQPWFINESRKACRTGSFLSARQHLLFWAVCFYRKPPNRFSDVNMRSWIKYCCVYITHHHASLFPVVVINYADRSVAAWRAAVR